jgi:hypothetical protein
MKNLTLTCFLFLSISCFTQNSESNMNPQLTQDFLFTNYDNIFIIKELKGKKVKIITQPECKIEKIRWEPNINIPCFKISEVPDVQSVTITILGNSKGGQINYGSFTYKVSKGKPK